MGTSDDKPSETLANWIESIRRDCAKEVEDVNEHYIDRKIQLKRQLEALDRDYFFKVKACHDTSSAKIRDVILRFDIQRKP